MPNIHKPISRQSNLVVQTLEDEVLIYDLNINKAFCLNQTSALIYQLCDGTNSVAEITELMSIKLKTKVPEDLVWLALEALKKDNLLENGKELTNHFVGMSRREVIRKVGIASMIALPIVVSIIAPITAGAASVDCSCINPGGCLTKTACPSTVNCNPSGQCAP